MGGARGVVGVVGNTSDPGVVETTAVTASLVSFFDRTPFAGRLQ